MSVGTIVVLVIVSACVIGVAVAVTKVLRAVKSVTSDVRSIVSHIPKDLDINREIEMELETTPKSLNAMTSVYLPQIEKDFPEFNYFEFKTRAENLLKSAFDAITQENTDLLVNASSDLTHQVSNIISSNQNSRQREAFSDVTVHRTEIKHYTKVNGTCKITLQSAIGYHHFIKSFSGQVISGSETSMKQTRYETELVYIQDTNQVTEGDTALGMNCPNCGAPIKALGNKVCPYCGSGVSEVNVRVWEINAFRES
ncbi:MAG: zinc ribbon domain-containing protein [Lachnospiraceae bacterium]|nr:zinc ribbon domain-containing protein [Lachnospiraceae bacterium]